MNEKLKKAYELAQELTLGLSNFPGTFKDHVSYCGEAGTRSYILETVEWAKNLASQIDALLEPDATDTEEIEIDLQHFSLPITLSCKYVTIPEERDDAVGYSQEGKAHLIDVQVGETSVFDELSIDAIVEIEEIIMDSIRERALP